MNKTNGRRLVNRVLRGFMQEIRAIFKRRAATHFREFPKAGRPCHSCALNPSTDQWQGWDSTANELMKAIRDDRPFYCHDNIAWRKPVTEWTAEEIQHFHRHKKLCAGYAVVVGDAAVKDAFIVAALTANGRKPCQEAVALAHSAIAGAGDAL